MARPKNPKAGPGRPKGVPNKVTTVAKEAFALAFEGLGGVPKLIEWAKANPSEFFKLYARLIPVQHTGTVGTFVVTVPPKQDSATTWAVQYTPPPAQRIPS